MNLNTLLLWWEVAQTPPSSIHSSAHKEKLHFLKQCFGLSYRTGSMVGIRSLIYCPFDENNKSPNVDCLLCMQEKNNKAETINLRVKNRTTGGKRNLGKTCSRIGHLP